jgi:hypothetical protein
LKLKRRDLGQEEVDLPQYIDQKLTTFAADIAYQIEATLGTIARAASTKGVPGANSPRVAEIVVEGSRDDAESFRSDVSHQYRDKESSGPFPEPGENRHLVQFWGGKSRLDENKLAAMAGGRGLKIVSFRRATTA